MSKRGEQRVFDPIKVSPSRLNQLAACGIAFEAKYLNGVPMNRSGSAALFGTVIHAALEVWALDRSKDLHTLVEQAWLDVTKGTVVRRFLDRYKPLSTEAIRTEFEIRQRRPDIKEPRRTGDWKKSDVYKKINGLWRRWEDKLNAESPWEFSEWDPLPKLYDESRVVAKRYESKWKHLPPALHTEMELNEPYHGHVINGYVDAIEELIHRDTGELLGVGVVDYKTYAKEPAEHKDWRQVVMYDVAIRSLVERGALVLKHDIREVPLLIGVDYVRLGERRFWKTDEQDYVRLRRELESYRHTIDNRAFLPAHKGTNPDYCDYGELCCLRSTALAGGSSPRVEVAL